MAQRDSYRGSARKYPRTARVDKVIHAVIAEALERSDDERLGLVTITEVHCDPDFRHAAVFYVARDADEDEVTEALEEARVGVQAAIGREVRMKRTPQLKFQPDPVMETGWRIEELLRQERERGSSADG